MITKQLMHDIITFCNNYIDNKNIILSITKYSTYLSVSFNVWTISDNTLQKCIGSVLSYIHNIDDFKKFKEKVLKELPKLLEQLKEN